MERVHSFLVELIQNNNREWFKDHKSDYELAKNVFLDFLGAIINQVQSFDKSIGIIQPKDALFRIYRDVRFSKDKSPYKTNMGGFISSGGRKGNKAGYYIHIEPGKSMVGGGIYQPDKETLKSLRFSIYKSPNEFLEIINQQKFTNTFGNLWDDKLVRPPKGFPADFEDIDLLKYKSYVVSKEFADSEVLEKDFFRRCVDTCKTMYPLNEFLNQAV